MNILYIEGSYIDQDGWDSPRDQKMVYTKATIIILGGGGRGRQGQG